MLAKYNNIWAIDVFKSCPMMLKNKNYEKCLLDERIGSCGKKHIIVEKNFFLIMNHFILFPYSSKEGHQILDIKRHITYFINSLIKFQKRNFSLLKFVTVSYKIEGSTKFKKLKIIAF